MLSSANFQPFGDRDQSVMDGLLRRQASLCLCALRNLSGPRCYMLPLRQSGWGDCGRPDLHLKLWGQWLHTHAILPPLACMQVSPSRPAHACRSSGSCLASCSAPGSRCAAQVVVEDEALRGEAEAMNADGRKLELEALHTLGLDFFTLFLRDKIMRFV